MLELFVTTAEPRVKVVFGGLDELPLDDGARTASELSIGAAPH